MTAPELDTILEATLGTNDAPTEDQRHELLVRLKKLENDFRRLSGQSFSSDLLRKKVLPQDAHACGRSVERYRSALSCLRSLPDEIWAQIFEEGLSTWWVGNHEYLQVLERVCRRWRVIALNHYPLWSQTPDINLPDISDPTPLHSQIRNLEPKLRVYLSRSGATPLSVTFKTSPQVWDDSDARALVESNLLSLLIAQCHRWQSAELCLPADVFNAVLRPIKGNIPSLQNLRLILTGPSTSRSQVDSSFQIDCFEDAPRLRDVKLTTPFRDPMIHVYLPWLRLETFEASTAGSYSFRVEDLIGGELIQLRVLDLQCHGSSPPFAFCPPVTLTKLEKLTISANQQSLSLLNVFDLITLPALSNLTIKGEFSPLERPARSLCSKVLDLIKRSKCSLQNLSFEFPSDTRQEALYHILSLSPNLAFLEIPHLDSEGLRKLVLAPDHPGSSDSSPNHPNILPKLKVLKFCWYGDFDSPITDPPYFSLNKTGVVDASALKDVVYSRTEALYGSDGYHSGEFYPLEEVYLRRYNTRKLESEWNKATNINAATTSDTLAQEFEEVLRNINWYASSHPDDRALQNADRANPEIYKQLDSQMREMESIDLESYPDTLVLARRNIPHLLEKIRIMYPGRIPGDGIFDIRRRAGKLSDKWKPFILRDARKLPYSWRYTGGVAAQLTCHSPAETHADQDKDKDEQTWANIISYHP